MPHALRSDQLRTKAASLILPQMALRLFGIKFLPPERTYSSLQTGKFPFAYCGLKIIPDFQRLKWMGEVTLELIVRKINLRIILDCVHLLELNFLVEWLLLWSWFVIMRIW
ncbi:hypothetical protein BROOK1789B_1934 [Bathymodiolus brooksi thiotrophic gill symbiont]|nr:hypothetical protein BROOK1789B_1934 [Bathymodiolus brooksi thiotrophic gill symbiont]